MPTKDINKKIMEIKNKISQTKTSKILNTITEDKTTKKIIIYKNINIKYIK